MSSRSRRSRRTSAGSQNSSRTRHRLLRAWPRRRGMKDTRRHRLEAATPNGDSGDQGRDAASKYQSRYSPPLYSATSGTKSAISSHPVDRVPARFIRRPRAFSKGHFAGATNRRTIENRCFPPEQSREDMHIAGSASAWRQIRRQHLIGMKRWPPVTDNETGVLEIFFGRRSRPNKRSRSLGDARRSGSSLQLLQRPRHRQSMRSE